MMIVARNMDYDDVLNAVKGRAVSVWTCNTCAKMCNGIGGKQSADRLADKLREDGVNVVASASVSAACLMQKVCSKKEEMTGADIIISLTCDTGAICASNAFKKDILVPLATLGHGFVDDDGSLTVTLSTSVRAPTPFGNAAKEKGTSTDPLV